MIDDLDLLRPMMAYEKGRTAPPEGFPALPDLPGRRYVDPRFYELEQEHLWKNAWLLAGHLDELPQIGAFKKWEQIGQPLFLIRAGETQVNAFYNTCRHRGAPVVLEETGKANLLVCKYHNWTYNHDGALVALRDPHDFVGLDRNCRSLKAVRCELYGRLIFVNLNPDAPPLLEALGPFIDEWKPFAFDRLRLVKRYEKALACNWKIGIEANMEVYHVNSIHPQTVASVLDYATNVNTLYPGGHGRMMALNLPATLVSGHETPPDDRPRIEGVGAAALACTQSYNVFPNFVSPMGNMGIPLMLFWPRGLRQSVLEVYWLGGDWRDAPRPKFWDLYMDAFDAVLEEDSQFGAGMQRSMESDAMAGIPLSYQEVRIYHAHAAMDEVIGRNRVPADLQVPDVIGQEWLHPADTETRTRLARSRSPEA